MFDSWGIEEIGHALRQQGDVNRSGGCAVLSAIGGSAVRAEVQ